MTRRALIGIFVVALLGFVGCSDPPEKQPVASGSQNPGAQQPRPEEADGRERVDPRRGGLDVAFGEYAITLESNVIRPGDVTFVVRNGGKLVHGFEIEIEDASSSGPGSGNGEDFEIEAHTFKPNEVVRVETSLEPGVYEVECYVANHEDLGMEVMLRVRRNAPLIKAPATNQKDEVTIQNFAFSPKVLEVGAQTDVRWVNSDPTEHTVTAQDGSFDSDPLSEGASFSTTLRKPGDYEYICRIHPTMKGTVRVVDST